MPFYNNINKNGKLMYIHNVTCVDFAEKTQALFGKIKV